MSKNNHKNAIKKANSIKHKDRKISLDNENTLKAIDDFKDQNQTPDYIKTKSDLGNTVKSNLQNIKKANNIKNTDKEIILDNENTLKAINDLKDQNQIPDYIKTKSDLGNTVKSNFHNYTPHVFLKNNNDPIRNTLAKKIGSRLLQIRIMLDQTRTEMSESCNGAIKPSALARFETGKVLISQIKAKYIATTLSYKFNIKGLTYDWLLTGKGDLPIVNAEKNDEINHKAANIIGNMTNINNDMDTLWILFNKCVSTLMYNFFSCMVIDQRMSPIYKKGDIVGGFTIPKSNWHKLSQTKVIIKLNNNDQMIRLIQASDQYNNCFIVSCYDLSYKPTLIHVNKIKELISIQFTYLNSENNLTNLNSDHNNENPEYLGMNDYYNTGIPVC